MSPTMTEGGIASWKKEEGESFATGDVLLEIETDKATIDVEAQEDGIMGKIISQAGSSKIPVGQIIAMLAEEGDDLSAIKVPEDLSPEGSTPKPSSSASEKEEKVEKVESLKEKKKENKEDKDAHVGKEVGHSHSKEIRHDKPLFPSVSRLLLESDLTSEQISKLKGTGKGGMLTKGDVLLALGKIQNAWGSAEKLNMDIMGPSGKRKSEQDQKSTSSTPTPKKEAPMDGPALRRLIVAGMSKATRPSAPIVPAPSSLPLSQDAIFDSILEPYASLLPPSQPRVNLPTIDQLAEQPKKDEWDGLF